MAWSSMMNGSTSNHRFQAPACCDCAIQWYWSIESREDSADGCTATGFKTKIREDIRVLPHPCWKSSRQSLRMKWTWRRESFWYQSYWGTILMTTGIPSSMPMKPRQWRWSAICTSMAGHATRLLTEYGRRTKLGNVVWNPGSIDRVIEYERRCGDVRREKRTHRVSKIIRPRKTDRIESSTTNGITMKQSWGGMHTTLRIWAVLHVFTPIRADHYQCWALWMRAIFGFMCLLKRIGRDFQQRSIRLHVRVLLLKARVWWSSSIKPAIGIQSSHMLFPAFPTWITILWTSIWAWRWNYMKDDWKTQRRRKEK